MNKRKRNRLVFVFIFSGQIAMKIGGSAYGSFLLYDIVFNKSVITRHDLDTIDLVLRIEIIVIGLSISLVGGVLI